MKARLIRALWKARASDLSQRSLESPWITMALWIWSKVLRYSSWNSLTYERVQSSAFTWFKSMESYRQPHVLLFIVTHYLQLLNSGSFSGFERLYSLSAQPEVRGYSDITSRQTSNRLQQAATVHHTVPGPSGTTERRWVKTPIDTYHCQVFCTVMNWVWLFPKFGIEIKKTHKPLGTTQWLDGDV